MCSSFGVYSASLAVSTGTLPRNSLRLSQGIKKHKNDAQLVISIDELVWELRAEHFPFCGETESNGIKQQKSAKFMTCKRKDDLIYDHSKKDRILINGLGAFPGFSGNARLCIGI